MIYEYFTKDLELRETKYFPRSHSQLCGRASLERRYLCHSSVLVPILLSQFSSVARSCPTLCDPMDCSTPGLPVHHQLPELPQTHVHQVGDTIQPSHPLSPPSPPALNLSQHQGLFFFLCIRWPKYWSFSSSISPSSEYSE